MLSRWPVYFVCVDQQRSSTIDSIVLEPKIVRPGVEIHATVRLRNRWPEERTPRVFFKVDDQVHASTFSAAANSYQATWIAGEKDGRFAVNLLLEWPLYGRTESMPLGSYVVDGVLPLVALDLKGAALPGDPPVFRNSVMILPSLIVRKPIARWRVTIKDDNDRAIAVQEENGNIPARLSWSGTTESGPVSVGVFTIVFDVWDEAGNTATTSAVFELNRTSPRVEVVAEKKDREVVVGLQRDDKVPLAYWRLEMWSEEGRLLKVAEGEELPPLINVELQPEEQNLKIEGVLVTEDVLGNRARQEIADFFPPPVEKVVEKQEAAKSATETWVNDF
jgi:hypothetical protein